MTFQRPTDGEHPVSGLATRIAPPATTEPRIGSLAYGSAEAAWPAGAAALVRWLRTHPELLGDVIGAKLQATDDEVAGTLPASVFVDEAGTRVLAMLELGASSEATLGTLLTQIGAMRAAVAVWICGEPRDEHVSAASWLNHSVAARFYVVRIRSARIDESAPAPILQPYLRPPRGAVTGGTGEGAAASERSRRASDHSEIVDPPPSP